MAVWCGGKVVQKRERPGVQVSRGLERAPFEPRGFASPHRI